MHGDISGLAHDHCVRDSCAESAIGAHVPPHRLRTCFGRWLASEIRHYMGSINRLRNFTDVDITLVSAATNAKHIADKVLSTSVEQWVRLKLTSARSEFMLNPPPGIVIHTPRWAASRAPLALAVEDFDPCGCHFRRSTPSAKTPAATRRSDGARAAAGDDKLTSAHIGKGLSSDVGASCVTYSVRSKILKFADVGTECLAEVGRVDIRFFQLFRDTGELLVNRAYAVQPEEPVTVHLATMQLLVHLGLLPRPSLPALLTLFVWGLAKCAVAMRETKKRVPGNIWHTGVAEALTSAWRLFQKGPFAGHQDETHVALSVLACLPRTILVQTEQFDAAVWDEVLEQRRMRQGDTMLDAVRTRHATHVMLLRSTCDLHAGRATA